MSGALERQKGEGLWQPLATEERDFRCFARLKNGTVAKKGERGKGGGGGGKVGKFLDKG